jgi:low affinity Fe/Cu permease
VGRPSKRGKRIGHLFERISQRVSQWAGSSWSFILAATVVLAWVVSGPLFGFSNTWQLVINTCTTIVTFLMVFLIQRSQNKESLAVQLKLNEIVAALQGASNKLIDVEDLSEDELATLRAHFRKLATMAKKDSDVSASHSVEEAEERHQRKSSPRPPKSAAR